MAQEPFIDKDGFKHYRMKAETGYIGVEGQEAFLKRKKLLRKQGEKFQFNYIQTLRFPMKRIKMKIPGFETFGLKYIIITEVKTNEVVFKAAGFTLFGMTRCRINRAATKRMIVGEKYKITIQEA